VACSASAATRCGMSPGAFLPAEKPREAFMSLTSTVPTFSLGDPDDDDEDADTDGFYEHRNFAEQMTEDGMSRVVPSNDQLSDSPVLLQRRKSLPGCLNDDGSSVNQRLKQENDSLREALAAASRKLTKLEDEQQCFFDEGVFDLVNSMCGRTGNSEEDARYEQLKRENHELRLQLLDEQQSAKDRIHELEIEFRSFAQRVASMSTAAPSAEAVAEAGFVAAPSMSSSADATAPTNDCGDNHGSSPHEQGSTVIADQGLEQEHQEDSSDVEQDQDSDDWLPADACHEKLRPRLVEALRRSAQLEQQGARRERIIIDLDTQTRQLERQLRAADRRNRVLEDRIARLQALAGCSFDFSPTARKASIASSRRGSGAVGGVDAQGEEEDADRLLASSEGEESILDMDETW